MSDSTIKVKGSWGGCFTLILFITFLWALLFGVTWKGQHHGMSCSCERGVGFE